MKHEKIGIDPDTGKDQCSCGELGFDHIRKVLMRSMLKGAASNPADRPTSVERRANH